MKETVKDRSLCLGNAGSVFLRGMGAFVFMALSVVNIVSPASAQAIGDTLCPEPKISSRQSPSDLANIQSDIERFTLCIERAELLNRLNRLVEENDELMGLTFGGAVQAVTQPPAAPRNAPTATTPLPDLGMAGSDLNGEEEVEDEKDYIWVIEEIYGISSDLKARLTNADSEIANVREGDVLSDGYRVEKIRGTTITLSKEGEALILNWIE